MRVLKIEIMRPCLVPATRPRITQKIIRLYFVSVIVTAGVCSAEGAPTFQLDPDNTRVVSVSNLYADPTCTSRKLRGTVVKRLFEDNRVMVAGFILELPDGSRNLIDVDADFTGLTLRDSGWIIRGLERMLTHGNLVEVTVKSCALGHIGNLDAVREAPPSQH